MNKNYLLFLPLLFSLFQNNSMMDHRKESQRIFRAQSHRTPDDMRSHKKRVDSPQEFSLDHTSWFTISKRSAPKTASRYYKLTVPTGNFKNACCCSQT